MSHFISSLPRREKDSVKWNSNDLFAYNITVIEQDFDAFFGFGFDSLPEYQGPPAFLLHEKWSVGDLGIDSTTATLLKLLEEAERYLYEGSETATCDFMVEMLRIIGYEPPTSPLLIRTRQTISLVMCQEGVDIETDITISDIFRKGLVKMVVRENQWPMEGLDFIYPEPELIAGAIAASQWPGSRIIEGQIRLPRTRIIPGITLNSTFPTFYKIKAVRELKRCLSQGLYPKHTTVVYRHTPRPSMWGSEHVRGMLSLKNREILWRYFQAFKKFVMLE